MHGGNTIFMLKFGDIPLQYESKGLRSHSIKECYNKCEGLPEGRDKKKKNNSLLPSTDFNIKYSSV